MGTRKVPLAFIPGVLTTHAIFRHQLEHLGDLAEMTCIDISKSGSVADMARLTLETMPPRFALCGYSMGGFAALEVLAREPERVTSCILIATSARADSDAQRRNRMQSIERAMRARDVWTDFWKAIFPRILHPSNANNPQLAALSQEMCAELGARSFIVHSRAMLERRDLTAILSRVTCPTLIIYSPTDPLWPAETSEEMHRLIPGSRLVSIDGCGHGIPIEAPERLTAAIRAFLAEQALAGERAAPRAAQRRASVPPPPTDQQPPAVNFLGRMVLEVARLGLRSADDFVRHFPPSYLMAVLQTEHRLRAEIAQELTGLDPAIGARKSVGDLAEDIRLGLEAQVYGPDRVADVFVRRGGLGYLDRGRLWTYITEVEPSQPAVDEARVRRYVAGILDAALAERVVSYEGVVQRIGTDEIARGLPHQLVGRILAAALDGRGLSYDSLLEIAPPNLLVEHLPLEVLWHAVVIGEIGAAVAPEQQNFDDLTEPGLQEVRG